MEPDGISDEALMAQLQAGDPDALRTLMERYSRPLHGYLTRMLSSSEDADDLFQDTFLRVLRNAHRFEPGRRFRPWLYTIATNLVKNTYRSRSYRQAQSLDAAPGDDGASLAGLLAARGRAAPGEMAAAAESAARVRTAVAALPDKGRTALVLYYFQGLPYEEIAGVLEIPLGTVKSRIHNAVARLTRLMVPDQEAQ